MKRALLVGGGALLIVVAALSARMLLGARAELGRADAAHDTPTRVRHLRRAMAYYLPLSPYVRAAHARLWRLARAADRGGRPQVALSIYRELRSAIVRLRSLVQPFSDDLPRLAARIAALSAAAPGASKRLQSAAGRRALELRLARPPAPRLGFSLLGLFGYAAFVVGGLLLIARGLTPAAAVVRRPFVAYLAVVAAGLLCFCVGMAYA